MKKFLGNHIVVLKNQLVMAATEIEVTPEGISLKLGGTETRVRAEDIVVVYETGEIDQLPIDPAILSTLATLEAGIRKYEEQGGREPIEEFLNRESLHWDYQVEFLAESTLSLMGDWQSSIATDAIEGNTRAFVAEFLPDITYEKLAQLAYTNLEKKLGRAHVLPVLPLPNVDLRKKIRRVPLDLD